MLARTLTTVALGLSALLLAACGTPGSTPTSSAGNAGVPGRPASTATPSAMPTAPRASMLPFTPAPIPTTPTGRGRITEAATARAITSDKRPDGQATEFALRQELFITYTVTDIQRGHYIDLKMYRDDVFVAL